ncbi:UDP-N-acetylglucosamine--undecaprenyl-phosphate N-acetylglucosaminephosphotransferase [Salinivibrio kushneri]|uniref:UDP-N-acetylglucosamine--undecaprenyl-phosphate N-acetylglucosaminephosphotransferase n=1 Tax=Salinivibrio kushneri TaxID=1908198 RepID=UPI0022B4F2FA|nr:UDP-N-acetylglucosamine--undecaprenyl-phosphate N-acetylglucosaminephosphotransferase [Salinivibrio kushneri]WBA10874.1 UDP-N-acetylglucosamine--undecaprenyl-phosphate N-acetylglucosaminephosphotransferase [Salinivibrio kushneri]
MINSFVDLALLLFFSTSSLFVLRKLARRIDLVDKPDMRKHHAGAVPLVGGLAVCLSLVYFIFNNPDVIPHSGLYATCMLVLVTIGVLDDKFDIDFKLRIGVQAALAVVMMVMGDIELSRLGNIFATGRIQLETLGYGLTVLAVIGAINAFNMVDGIDGLLGGLATVTFVSLGLLLFLNGHQSMAYLCLVLTVIMAPYLLFNLGILGRERKVFMGDAGSMLIGFTVIWFLLLASQHPTNAAIRPVTGLWLIALPLMDMTAIMFRRVKRGDSPFKPDREHLHHIFQRMGLSPRQTLGAICLLATALASIGMIGELFNIHETIMFISFLVCFALYCMMLRHIWRVTSFIRAKLGKNEFGEKVGEVRS